MAFDYQSLIDEAMLGVVKKILIEIEIKGIRDDQSFYLSFRTNFPGVILSDKVKEKYPKEITIILQHQFRNLAVINDKFMVNISFNGRAENIEVPFNAITSFLDPAANFGFQFAHKKPAPRISNKGSGAEILASESKFIKSAKTKVSKKLEGNVVAMDKFRKKRDESTKKN